MLVQTQGNIKIRYFTLNFWLELKNKSTNKEGKKFINAIMQIFFVNEWNRSPNS